MTGEQPWEVGLDVLCSEPAIRHLAGRTPSETGVLRLQPFQVSELFAGRTPIVAVGPGGSAEQTLAWVAHLAGNTVWWVGEPVPSLPPGALIGADTDPTTLAEAAGRAGQATTQRPAVTVIATVLNEGDELVELVADVLAQMGPDDEFVLVDGGSTDGSVERLDGPQRDERLRVVIEPGLGISQGRNLATRIAVQDLIVAVDAGCPLKPGAIDIAARALTGEGVGLVSGVYRPSTRTAMEAAQAAACYPDTAQVLRPDVWTRFYGKVFGTAYDPRFAVGRCMAYTRQAWDEVGGFPEHLATGEDVGFSLAISRRRRVVGAAGFAVDWYQRESSAKTFRMYRNYGLSSTDGGDTALLIRDLVRAGGYVGAALACTSRMGRRAVLVGGTAYLSLPVARWWRGSRQPAALPLLPVALVTKDLGKVWGAVQGAVRARAPR